MWRRQPPRFNQFGNCATKHFVDLEQYLRSSYSEEEISCMKNEEKWEKVCKVDVPGHWFQMMKAEGLDEHDRWRNTLMLCEYEDMCGILRNISPKFKITLPGGKHYLVLVGPVLAYTILPITVPDSIPSEIRQHPFAVSRQHYDRSVVYPDEKALEKKVCVGEAGEDAYAFSACVEYQNRPVSFRTDPLKFQFVMLMCSEDLRPYHLEFAVSDTTFIAKECEENYALLADSHEFRFEVKDLKRKYRVQVEFDAELGKFNVL